MRSRKEQFLDGAHTALPTILGFVPVGIAYAVMARQAGLTAAETELMSAAVFAGASQMMAAGMVAAGSGAVAIVIATFILNLRHLIMSTCVFNRIRGERLPLRLLGAFGVTDESFGMFTTTEAERATLPFLLGMNAVSYLSWLLGTLLGALGADFLPRTVESSLSIALYAMFIGILIPKLRGKKQLWLLVLLSAALNAALQLLLPASWALIAATLLAAWCGMYFVDTEEAAAHE